MKNSRSEDGKRLLERVPRTENVERVQEGLGSLILLHLADVELRSVQNLVI